MNRPENCPGLKIVDALRADGSAFRRNVASARTGDNRRYAAGARAVYDRTNFHDHGVKLKKDLSAGKLFGKIEMPPKGPDLFPVGRVQLLQGKIHDTMRYNDFPVSFVVEGLPQAGTVELASEKSFAVKPERPRHGTG